MTKSDVKSLDVKHVPEKSLDLHYEQPLGTTVTEVDEETDFFCVGYYKENSDPIINATIWCYQTDEDGNPVSPIVSDSDTTNSNGKYEIEFSAPDISSDTTIYFRAYDSAQKPT